MIQCPFYAVQSEVAMMRVQMNLAEGIWENLKDGLEEEADSRHKRRSITQAQMEGASGTALKSHFTAKFKYKFITINFIWAFQV